MENEKTKLTLKKQNYYNSLLDKYLHYSFNNAEEEKAFIEHLKNLLNENEEEVEFEAKMWFLNGLTAGLRPKKFGFVY